MNIFFKVIIPVLGFVSLIASATSAEPPSNSQQIYTELCALGQALSTEKTKEDLTVDEVTLLGVVYGLRNSNCYDLDLSQFYLNFAAEMGGVEAQFQLCSYYQGILDGISAYKWCYIASVNGNEKAQKYLAFMNDRYDKHAISKAKKIGKEWLRKFD
jgi:TPR repeat protein